MAPRTRYFLVGSGLVVAVGLCTGLVAYYSGGLPGGSARRAELAYVPRTANALGYADVADIMGSPFHQHLQKLLPTGNDKVRFQEETGIDIERDIDSVVVAVSGEGAAKLGGLFVVRGRFDQTKIEGIAMGHGATAETYRDVRLLVAPEEAGGPEVFSGSPCIAFLESGLLAFGTRDAIKQGIDASLAGSGASQDAEIMAAVAGVERRGNAWFVARTDVLASQTDLPDVVRQHMNGIRWVAVGADVDRGVSTIVRAETRDPQAAQDLRAVINGAVAAIRLMSNRDARFESAINSLQTSGSGSIVELQFTLPAELLDVAKEAGPIVH